MRVLFDHNVDRRFRAYMTGHQVVTAREQGWERLTNGKFLRAAADAGFDGILSIDKKLRFEQNLDKLPIAVIVLDSISNALPALVPFAPFVLNLLSKPLSKVLYLIETDGRISRWGSASASE